jgi:hypothetical protein
MDGGYRDIEGETCSYHIERGGFCHIDVLEIRLGRLRLSRCYRAELYVPQ